MSEQFEMVKSFLQDLDLDLEEEDTEEELVIANSEDRGIKNLIVDCEDPILIIEQGIMPLPNQPGDLFRRLLEMNRTLIHGAFALDEESGTIVFRDTLRLDTLDRGEIESSINALSLALVEHAEELLNFSRN